MDQKIEFNEVNRLWWPKWETRQQAHFEYHTKHLKDAAYFAQNSKHGVCFQAGGNVGIWPNYFSIFFKRVITAEADPDLYECLVRNRAAKNIDIINGAVGAEEKEVTFYRTGKSGTGTLNPQSEVVSSFLVRQFTIDSLNLNALDAIYLDIEGHEEPALKGGRETIQRFKPLICAETFDRTREGIDKLMSDMGYKFVKKFGRDQVYAAR